jgi:predicted regulator of Ras-like GTPase activity (Roadblock/LC7/MglB family)
MEFNLSEYLEYLCNEHDDLSSLFIVNNEGFTLVSSGATDRTLVSGMCTALKCISQEFILEMTNSKNLERMLVDCTDGVILIKPLNKEGILVASCRDAGVLNKLDIKAIQSYFENQQDQIVAF